MMQMNNVVLICTIGLLIGILLGLVFRIIREGVEFNSRIFFAVIKYLIVYPLLFPFILNKRKELFAEIIAVQILQDTKKVTVAKKNRIKVTNKLKRMIIKDLNYRRIFLIWLDFLRSVSKGFDEFVHDNIELAKDTIAFEEEENKTIVDGIGSILSNLLNQADFVKKLAKYKPKEIIHLAS